MINYKSISSFRVRLHRLLKVKRGVYANVEMEMIFLVRLFHKHLKMPSLKPPDCPSRYCQQYN